MPAIELNATTFGPEVLKSDVPVLVDFWAPWCRPCRMMAPILDELSEEFAGKLKITKIDVDDPAHMFLAERYNVQGIPNMQLFKKGEVVKEFVGARHKEMFREELEGALAG